MKVFTLLDKIDRLILNELEKNSRISYCELGRRLSISNVSAKKRIHKLEKTNVIMGYSIHLNHKKLNETIQAIVRIKANPTLLADLTDELSRLRYIEDIYQIANDYSLIIFFRVQSVHQLQQTVDQCFTNKPGILKMNTELILKKYPKFKMRSD